MVKIIIPADLDTRISNAIDFFWTTRSEQKKKQNDSDIHNQNNRSAVTGGKQLDGFVELISDILVMNGVPKTSIFTNSDLELPGFYRPNKKWDLLVIDRNELVIALERQYSAACFLTTSKGNGKNTYTCPNDKLTYNAFIRTMLGAVLAHF